MRKKLVVLSGAGMSAESGLKTFRDADGLWEGHSIYAVATPEAWNRNPDLVNDFYNQRRKQLSEVTPNSAHLALASLEEEYEVIIITQNVDDLHERAGSSQVLHLHGELNKVRSIGPDQEADSLVVIGTSLHVYPAAGLVHEAPTYIPRFYITQRRITLDD